MTTESEYIVLGQVAREAVWIKRLINEMKVKTVKKLTIYGNNEMSINLIRNIESQYSTKHIDIQCHYFRELVNKKEFIVE